jgi:aspartate racemase
MKTIGLIGGMSWESSIEYYRLINEQVRNRMGGNHSAKSVMVSVDFAEIEELQHQGRWAEAADLLVTAARNLELAGADFVVLCTNTMHKVAEEIQNAIHIPFLHIADATAQPILSSGLRNVGLLGTRFTMEESFYKERLKEKFGLNVLIPGEGDREFVHHVIYNELVKGVIKETSRGEFLKIISKLVENGAQGVILGCTEIGLLVKSADCSVPVFDTTQLHAKAAVDYALKE